MNWPIAVVLIVMIVAVGKVMAAKYRAQAGIIQDKQGNQQWVGKNDDPEAQREIENLRERIKVLERIATDGNSLDAKETRRISAEIEALRDKQVEKDN
ncbi:hypothetical protein GRI34_01020 [Erythrobacter aquimaris]|uniref:Uncharacterized protein n=1 Tax=Qipengyuania aquimaris TaxID=255984 RepID=A0A6I4TGV9_9SPHN|nr:hypothetical protein [Qipengyuania aquimaris]MXO94996.1 hypothetical protein [Qipengyuania aquimaris]